VVPVTLKVAGQTACLYNPVSGFAFTVRTAAPGNYIVYIIITDQDKLYLSLSRTSVIIL